MLETDAHRGLDLGDRSLERNQRGRLALCFWACLWTCVALSLVLQIGLAIAFPNVFRPDEVFQNLEPAHAISTGYGVQTWEWRAGIRSWFLPALLSLPMRLLDHQGAAAGAYLTPIHVMMALITGCVVALGVLLGWRHSRLLGASLCGILCATWPDMIYFGPKTLGEVQGGNLLVIATVLAVLVGLDRAPAPGSRGRRQDLGWLALVGLLAGLTFCVRFQLAPAILLLAVWCCRLSPSRWLAMAAGGVGPLLALGITDYLVWGRPFQSIWLNFIVNVNQGRSEIYGVLPIYWYPVKLVGLWGAAILPLALCFLLGMRHLKPIATMAATIAVVHSFVGHKEISFVYGAIPLALLVIGVGTAELVELTRTGLRTPFPLGYFGSIAVAAWLAIGMSVSVSGFRTMWYSDADYLHAVISARSERDLCGLGLYGPKFEWYHTGGYAFLDRPVPIFLVDTPADLERTKNGFNFMLADRQLATTVSGFTEQGCWHQMCLLKASWECGPTTGSDINQTLKERND
jgi:hypothetical protein